MRDDGTPGQVLSFTSREVLSWMTAAYMLRELADPVRLLVTHPGGGMYDCLTLTTDRGEHLVSMNRDGSSAALPREVIPDIWTVAGTTPGQGPLALAYLLLSEGGFPVEPDKPTSGMCQAAIVIANLLNLHRDHRVSAIPIWHGADVYGDLEEDLDLLHCFSDVGDWLDQPPPLPGMTPSGWLFAFIYDGEPKALINTMTGDIRYRKPLLHPPVATYRDAFGNPACPIAMSISCTGFDGTPMLTDCVQPMHFAHRFARNMSQEAGIVTQTPLFAVPRDFVWDPEPFVLPDNYLD